MKFLCVRCDEAMKLAESGPPDAQGSLTAVFACPECGHRIAMLTNPSETQMVQSLGVRIGPREETAAAARCPFPGVVEGMAQAAAGARIDWTPEAEQRLAGIPEFVRPMARQGIESFALERGLTVIDEAVLEEARSRFGM